MLLREVFYKRERETLSPYAMLCENSKGRRTPIEESDMRTEYMRDRDRIIHCKAFRRLKDKTQVFINPEGSHYRTRLTHTLEVAQISRTIARCLALNEDLTEAAALGHDLGHTPFGHAGEVAITQFYRENNIDLEFWHNEQSLRIVDTLENGKGLDLTYEVRDGILNHKKSRTPETLEGMAVNFADRIAYLNHDIDDALRAGIITIDDLPKECMDILGRGHSERLNTMITDIVEQSFGKPKLCMSKDVAWATDRLREYMFQEVYVGSPAKEEEKKVKDVIFLLMEYYMKHPEALPEDERIHIERDGLMVCIADYIAGMTDKFAVMKFQEFFVPHGWALL